MSTCKTLGLVFFFPVLFIFYKNITGAAFNKYKSSVESGVSGGSRNLQRAGDSAGGSRRIWPPRRTREKTNKTKQTTTATWFQDGAASSAFFLSDPGLHHDLEHQTKHPGVRYGPEPELGCFRNILALGRRRPRPYVHKSERRNVRRAAVSRARRGTAIPASQTPFVLCKSNEATNQKTNPTNPRALFFSYLGHVTFLILASRRKATPGRRLRGS